MIQPTLIDLHPDEYTKGLRYYSFAINLGNLVGYVFKINKRFK